MLKTKLTQLNIRYDPEYPFDWVPEAEYYENKFGCSPPMFPYNRGRVEVLGLSFSHNRVNTGGFDPYLGSKWSCRVGKFCLEVSGVVIWTAKLTRGYRTLFDIREFDFRTLPWPLRRLWAFLESRLDWWEFHTNDFGDRYHE